jgi:hypothetical protein
MDVHVCKISSSERGTTCYCRWDGGSSSLWFDVAGRFEFEHCVIISMDEDYSKEDSRKTYHSLLFGRKLGTGDMKG